MNQDNNIKCNLIIIPNQLIQHWENTFKLASNLKVYCINKLSKLNNLDNNNIINYDVILCPGSKYSHFEKKFFNYKWNRIIIDEASEINLPLNLKWTCNFVWLLTSRLNELFYSKKGYLKPIFGKLSYYTFNHLIIKSEPIFLKKSINLPKIERKNILYTK